MRGSILWLKVFLLLLLCSVLFATPLLSEEEPLRLLIWEGYAPEKYIREFENNVEKKYGRKVKLKVSYVESPDDFFNAVRNLSVDLITISHHTIKDERFGYIAKGLIIPFDLQNIPNHINLIPDLKQADFHLHNGKTYGIPVANGPYGLAYNTEKFKQTPQSWDVFWDPEYKKKYAIGAYEYIYNVNITAMILGYPREQISNFDVLNNKVVREKLRQLAVNANTLWVGVDKPDDLQGLSLATSWGDSLSELQRRGETWKMAAPKEGTIWWVDEYVMTQSLAEKPFLKKVAEEWINMSLSSEFQIDHLIREVGIYPVVVNINDKLTAEENKRIQPEEFGSFMEKHVLQTTYSIRDRNGLQLLWDEAMSGIKKRKN